jgi:hypothetical protein
LGRAVYPTIGSTFNAQAKSPSSGEVEMGLSDLPYDVPNIRIEVGEAESHTRIGWLRSVSKDGKLSIPKVWISLDAGLIVSPDRVRAQVEGAAIMATTQARDGKITFKNGRVGQSNYDDYSMATMSDAPREINVDIVNSQAAPAGVGETTVPSFAPALCNAMFAATGKRIRDLPLSDHDLSWS